MHATYAAGSSGYLDKKNNHTGLLVAAVALHVGLLGALLSYHAQVGRVPERPMDLQKFVRVKPLPTIKPDRPKQAAKAPTIRKVDGPTIIIEPLPPTREPWPEQPPLPPTGGGGGGIGSGGTTAEPPVPVPVMTSAGIDLRYVRDLQPPYPAALERAEFEGSVTVRIQIAPDGRITAVELVRADDPAFFASTRDWALRRWRFKPATRDGVAVSSWLTKTVQFRIVRNR